MPYTSFSRVWQDVAFFLLDHWGEFATSVCVAPRLSDDQMATFQRQLELDGTNCFVFSSTEQMLSHYDRWLAEQVPLLWGPKEDLVRMALIIHCEPGAPFCEEGARHELLAPRFPFPMVFVLPADADVVSWLEEHRLLVGNQADCFVDS